MKFGYIGIDYKHADQDIRDRVSFTDNQKIDFLQKAGKAGCLLYTSTSPRDS